jgi:hypothetical protein
MQPAPLLRKKGVPAKLVIPTEIPTAQLNLIDIFLVFHPANNKKEEGGGGRKRGERRRKKKGKDRGESEGRATPSHSHSKWKQERLFGFKCILSWCSARNSRWMVTLACVLI